MEQTNRNETVTPPHRCDGNIIYLGIRITLLFICAAK